MTQGHPDWVASPIGLVPKPVLPLVLVLATLLALLVAAGVFLLFGWPFILSGFWSDVQHFAQTPWKRILASAGLAVVAYVLFLVRENARSWYGAAEIIIGVALCWAGLGAAQTASLAASASAIGGVYVTVRGLDNWKQGRGPADNPPSVR